MTYTVHTTGNQFLLLQLFWVHFGKIYQNTVCDNDRNIYSGTGNTDKSPDQVTELALGSALKRLKS